MVGFCRQTSVFISFFLLCPVITSRHWLSCYKDEVDRAFYAFTFYAGKAKKVQVQVSYLEMLVFTLVTLQEIANLIAHLSTKPWLCVETPRKMKLSSLMAPWTALPRVVRQLCVFAAEDKAAGVGSQHTPTTSSPGHWRSALWKGAMAISVKGGLCSQLRCAAGDPPQCHWRSSWEPRLGELSYVRHLSVEKDLKENASRIMFWERSLISEPGMTEKYFLAGGWVLPLVK